MKQKIKYNALFPFIMVMGMLFLFFSGCKKEKDQGPVPPPVITTDSITDITQSTAVGHATIVSNGGKSVWGRARVSVSGVCWGIQHNPTVEGDKTINGPMIGNFMSPVKGLDPFTTYYVRAYATNPAGTVYGEEVSFTTTGPLAVLKTEPITDLTSTSATSGGVIVEHGEAVTARGLCWSAKDTPTVADAKTVDGSGDGSFISKITGLEGGVKYLARAYATNPAGTGYGNVISFVPPLPTVKDVDGNVYHQVKIGNQYWMVENFRAAHFNDGTPIAGVAAVDDAYVSVYGMLYPMSAATDTRLAPPGWHVPTEQDWDILATYVKNSSGPLKETGTTHWASPNVGATNSTGFTALPGGLSYSNSSAVSGKGAFGIWWTSTPADASNLWRRSMVATDAILYDPIKNGGTLCFSIRLVKN